MWKVFLPHARNVRSKVRPIGERWVEDAQRGHGEVREGVDEEYLEGWMPEEMMRRHVG